MNDLTIRFSHMQVGSLPDLLKFEWIDARKGFVRGRFKIQEQHFSPHGFLHGATIVALADTACGFGCLTSLPDGATSFSTAELKTNFIGAVQAGVVTCSAQLVHGGRTTQVWDAEVINETQVKKIALFRCTQVILYPTAQQPTVLQSMFEPDKEM